MVAEIRAVESTEQHRGALAGEAEPDWRPSQNHRELVPHVESGARRQHSRWLPRSPGNERMVGSIKGTHCSICKHDDRARIELLLARGASRRHIGARFNCSPDAVWRHWRNGHVSEHVKSQLAIQALKPGETLEKLVQDESIGLLENLQRIRATLYASFDAAAEVGDRQAVSKIGLCER